MNGRQRATLVLVNGRRLALGGRCALASRRRRPAQRDRRRGRGRADRLRLVKDPTVQRLVPKLIASLDRAIRLCVQTLDFGQAQAVDVTSPLPFEPPAFDEEDDEEAGS